MARSNENATSNGSPSTDTEAGVQEAVDLYEAAMAYYAVAEAQYVPTTETISTGSVGLIVGR